jgi:hypothetical protein
MGWGKLKMPGHGATRLHAGIAMKYKEAGTLIMETDHGDGKTRIGP